MKLESTNLRVGNLISITQSAHKDDIEAVTSFMIQRIEDGYKVFGIPLTEDILLKHCKFTNTKDTDSFGGFLSPELPNGNKIRLKKDGNVFVWNTQHAIVKLEFLHELQNFYSIFNTELEINLNN